ncbi:hypothetical protein BX616_005924, partial [Lobosporangium transversale]
QSSTKPLRIHTEPKIVPDITISFRTMVQGGRMKKPVVAEACQAVASIPVKISNNDNHQVFKEAIEDLFGRQNGAASSTVTQLLLEGPP